ncbi:hypothetical protein SLE2022_182630 [Rubroshorea leprosula]
MFNPTNNLSQQKHAKFPDFLGQRIAESFDVLNLGVVRTQKTVQSYGNYRSWNGREGQFADVEDESGVRTPPLWPGSPPRRPNHYRCLSPASKAQAIERGQRELMELVSKMPESCYELSLKDLVEQPMMEVKQETTAVDKDNYSRKTEGKKKKKKNEKKAQISRSGSIDNGGFLLKMVFPVSLGSKKKKTKNDSNSTSNCNSKVSPRPSFSDASAKVEEKEWWKKTFSGPSEIESCGSSINSRSTKSSRSSSCSSSTSTDSRRHGMGNCCSFIRTRKSDTSE